METPEYQFFPDVSKKPDRAFVLPDYPTIVIFYYCGYSKNPAGVEFLRMPANASHTSILQIIQPNIRNRNIEPGSVVFVQQTAEWTLIPDELYKPELKRNYLEIVHELIEKQEVGVDPVTEIQAKLVYSSSPDYLVGEMQNSHVIRYWISASVRHNSTKPSVFPAFYCNFGEKFLDMLVLENGKAKLCNRFYLNSSEETLYHILNVIKLKGGKPERDKIFLSGRIIKDSPTFQLINRYLAHPEFLKIKAYHSDEFISWQYFAFLY
ncbi:MAG: DUF3822 family protein [Bacteroidetes bacterium]|nr:DUF3822 family protein [Bacteroidota bacterium]MBU1719014.1 DUF3822 family protein [Bacteroidota bacterium]